MRWRGGAGCFAAAALSGGLLALADHPLYAALLQLVAFVPFFVALHRDRCSSWRRAAIAGAVFGAARCALVGPALLDLPSAAWIALPAYLLALHAAFGVACFATRRLPAFARPIAHACAYVALELVDAHLPMWGTALSLACAWQHHPEAIRFVAWSGAAGVAALLVCAQSMLVSSWELGTRARAVTAFAVALGLGGCEALPAPRDRDTLRVAAIGWAARDAGGIDAFGALVDDAAARGARLVVSPEGAFVADPGQRASLLRELGDIARAHRLTLAVDYIDRAANENRVAFLGPDGALEAEYTKTHLVPLVETTRPSRGGIAVVDVDGVKVGAMICQDDNFGDVGAAYARAGAQIVVTPTFEMSPKLAALHAREAMLRALEGRFAVVRAVANGTSAAVGSDGRLVASSTPHDGAIVLVADVPYDRRSPRRERAEEPRDAGAVP